jgi:hypothetical protein
LVEIEPPYPIAIKELETKSYDRFVAMKSDRALSEMQEVGLKDLVILEDFPALSLIKAPGDFATSVTEMEASVTPVYVRPAVFTPPVIRK